MVSVMETMADHVTLKPDANSRLMLTSLNVLYNRF